MEKEWFMWEKVRRIFPMQIIDVMACMNFFQPPGIPFATGVKLEEKNIELLAVESGFLKCAKSVANSLISDPENIESKLNKIDETALTYFDVAREVLSTNVKKKSDKELLEIFEKMYSAYKESHNSGALLLISEFREEFLSIKIRELLEKRLAEKKLGIEMPKAFALLSHMQRPSVLAEEKFDSLGLIEKVLADNALKNLFEGSEHGKIQKGLKKSFPEFNTLLESHWNKYKWIFFMYEGPTLPRSYFVKKIKENLSAVGSIRKEFEQNKKIQGLQKKLLKRLCSGEKDKLIFSFPRRLIETKALRKDAMYFGCFVFEKLFGEMAKRLEISLDQVRYMQEQELVDAMNKKFKDFDMLNERIKYSVFFTVGGKRTFLVGDEAKKWYSDNVIVEEVFESNELKGASAFPGHVRGRVKIISHPNEIFKMNKGDILVSHATNPNLLPAMDIAAAIVTDIGGLTCHAAIVSREFRIPCVVGTKYATQVLQDNDLVEVDAEKGIIKIIGG